MIPVIIACQPNSEGSGLVASTLEWIDDDVYQRILTFNPDGTYAPSEPVLVNDQEYARSRISSGLLYPTPLTRLLQVKDFIPEDEYREAFGYVDTNGTILIQRRFNEIVEAGREVANIRQALEEMSSRRWPEG